MTLRALLLALALGSSPVLADHGTGAGDRKGSVIRGESALARLGSDVVRFSSTPALGGRGMSFTAVARPDGSGMATVRYYRGHPALGWRGEARIAFILNSEEWAGLRAVADAAIAAAEPPDVYPDGSLSVCTDGPGYRHERFVAGTTRWMTGFCGRNHPNQALADKVNALLASRLADF